MIIKKRNCSEICDNCTYFTGGFFFLFLLKNKKILVPEVIVHLYVI